MLLEAKYSLANGCKMKRKMNVEIFTKGLKALYAYNQKKDINL